MGIPVGTSEHGFRPKKKKRTNTRRFHVEVKCKYQVRIFPLGPALGSIIVGVRGKIDDDHIFTKVAWVVRYLMIPTKVSYLIDRINGTSR